MKRLSKRWLQGRLKSCFDVMNKKFSFGHTDKKEFVSKLFRARRTEMPDATILSQPLTGRNKVRKNMLAAYFTRFVDFGGCGC